jgi:hypothetical protein
MTKEISNSQVKNSAEKVKAVINIIHNDINNDTHLQPKEILLNIKENFIFNKAELGALISLMIEAVPNFSNINDQYLYSSIISLMIEELNNLLKVSN